MHETSLGICKQEEDSKWNYYYWVRWYTKYEWPVSHTHALVKYKKITLLITNNHILTVVPYSAKQISLTFNKPKVNKDQHNMLAN